MPRSRLAAALCVLLTLPPAPVDAAGATDEAGVAEAQRLYKEGKTRYDTADFHGAIELWTRAYGALEESPETQEIRSALMFNLASARFEAYEVDHDVAQLRKARILLERYLEGLPAAAEERGETEAWLTKIDDAIAAHAAAQEPAPPPPADEAPPPDRGPQPGLGLIVGGSVLVAGGLGLVSGMAASLARGQRLEEQGTTQAAGMNVNAGDLSPLVADGEAANRLAIILGAAGGVTTIVGAALLGVGVGRRKKAERVALTPSLAPGRAGLVVTGRF